MSVIPWILLTLWDLTIAYVFINVRKVMANNHIAIARLSGKPLFGVTERAVLMNRIALIALLALSNWGFLRFGPG